MPDTVQPLDAEPEITALDELKPALDGCRRCPLWEPATQGVPGEGPKRARIMFVGEQPGDQEDRAGRPFVGPAGRVFDTALERVGVPRSDTYVTNAVKHFKFAPRGKRRLHQRPDAGEIRACNWWLGVERRLVRPKLIVALGATAVRGVTGKTGAISKLRGEVRPLDDDAHFLVTVHPSYLLRIREEDRKRPEWNRFLADLKLAKEWIEREAA